MYTTDDMGSFLHVFFVTEQLMPDPDRHYLYKTTAWPDLVRNFWESYGTEGAQERLKLSVRPKPTPHQVDEMDRVAGWLATLWQGISVRDHLWPLKREMLLHLYAKDASYRDVAYEFTYRVKMRKERRYKVSHQTIKRWHDDIITRLCKISNANSRLERKCYKTKINVTRIPEIA